MKVIHFFPIERLSHGSRVDGSAISAGRSTVKPSFTCAKQRMAATSLKLTLLVPH
jgi:hypothetical protein